MTEMKQKWINAYMDVAERFAQLSSARRLKVGAVVVKDHRVISIGYNGTPAGWDNNCEDTVYVGDAGGWIDPEEIDQLFPHSEWDEQLGRHVRYNLKTKDEVIHAEANAITKLARSNDGGDGAYLFCTHAPCIDCAKLIYGAGIRKVYYRDTYKDERGVRFLERSNVAVEKVPQEERCEQEQPQADT